MAGTENGDNVSRGDNWVYEELFVMAFSEIGVVDLAGKVLAPSGKDVAQHIRAEAKKTTDARAKGDRRVFLLELFNADALPLRISGN